MSEQGPSDECNECGAEMVCSFGCGPVGSRIQTENAQLRADLAEAIGRAHFDAKAEYAAIGTMQELIAENAQLREELDQANSDQQDDRDLSAILFLLQGDAERKTKALRNLANEVDGLVAFEPEIRAVILSTNWNVLRLRAKEASEALAPPTTPEPGGETKA